MTCSCEIYGAVFAFNFCMLIGIELLSHCSVAVVFWTIFRCLEEGATEEPVLVVWGFTFYVTIDRFYVVSGNVIPTLPYELLPPMNAIISCCVVGCYCTPRFELVFGIATSPVDPLSMAPLALPLIRLAEPPPALC